MRGRKPIPDSIRALRGEAVQPTPPQSELPTPPDHLDPVAREEWERLASAMHKIGLLDDVDRVAFAAYCQSYSRWVAAELRVSSEGLTVTQPNGRETEHPCIGVAKDMMRIMRQFLVEFGLTPSSRSRMKAPQPDASGEDDDFELFRGEADAG